MNLNLRSNTLWALGEVILNGIVLFVLYKVVISSLGIKALGIWSIVLATTTLGRLADIGTASGLSRFVAAAEANKDSERTLAYAETSIISTVVFFTGIALVIAAPAYYALALTMDGDSLVLGRQLLPFSLVSFVLISVAYAPTSALIGQHRADQKSMITSAGTIVLFTTAVLFVPRYGLLALAWAQIAQHALMTIGGWLLFLRNHFNSWTFRLPIHWRKDIFKEIIGFGMKLQIASIVWMAWDPVVKFLMSSVGGLEIVGFYEMTQRLFLQVTKLVVTPNLVLVPSFAHLMESEPEKIGPLYHNALALSLFFGLPLMGGVALLSPAISYIWIGHVEMTFVILSMIFSCSGFLSLVAMPANFLGIGTSYLKGNIYGVLISMGGLCLQGFLFGHMLGGLGVALVAGFMSSVGSLLSMVMNCRQMKVNAFPEMSAFLMLSRSLRQMLVLRKLTNDQAQTDG